MPIRPIPVVIKLALIPFVGGELVYNASLEWCILVPVVVNTFFSCYKKMSKASDFY